MLDITKLSNPYDFANLVMDRELFAGRAGEMSDIRYYLDHAAKAPRPINLAIMGERASGKTSLLNMVQEEAKKRGLCAVRINLDEADSHSQMAFFYKIFDSLFTTACSYGAYGGRLEKTYQFYRNMVDANDIPEDKTFCPFIFPFQYSNATSKGNEKAALSDTAFNQDIVEIQKEIDQPVALLFDECDVLTKSRVHLEKLRNIFMNASGFMLVFTGTPALFPLMDDVFSPIVRQFKKINMGPFEEKKETENCVDLPLQKIGITSPREIISLLSLREIHELSAGRPYEIQLICHLLFRRVQEGRAKRMELNLDVLDEVRRELERSQDISLRPVLAAVRNLNKEELSALRTLCATNGRATFDQIWFAEYLFWGETRRKKDQLRRNLEKFEHVGVIKVEDGRINFLGDDFDRIYCKYFARKQGVALSISDPPYEMYMMYRLDAFLNSRAGANDDCFFFFYGGAEKPEVKEIALELAAENGASDVFQSRAEIALDLYWASIDFRGCRTFKVGTVTIGTPWITVYTIYRNRDPKGAESFPLESFISILAEGSKRAIELGGKLGVDIEEIPVMPLEVLVRKVEKSENSRARENLSEIHLVRMADSYINRRDMKEALFHADLSYRYNPDPSPGDANNLGYVYMVWENFERARALFEKAARDHAKPQDAALPVYNLGVLEAKEGNIETALANFDQALECLRDREKESTEVACLVLPKISADGSEVEFEELRNPKLLDTAKSACSAMRHLLTRRTL